MIPGTMMHDYPLTLTAVFERAGTFFGRNDIVTRALDGSIHRYVYADYQSRVHQLSNALRRLGVESGDRVATLCWNHYRHYEAYAAVPAVGAILHTLNLRLHADDLAYIADHAGDSVVIVDQSLLPVLDQFKSKIAKLRGVIVISDGEPIPDGYHDYEALLAAESNEFDAPTIDENQGAAMCYTSGTTGRPKGVIYSHRSTVLHTLAACMTDALGICENDRILVVVPMFHANAWGIPYCAAMTGASVIFPERDLRPEPLLDLMVSERITLAAGVPTIWNAILAALDENPGRWDLSALRMTVVGGSAAPPAMIDGFERRHGVHVLQAWGMTETNPLGTLCRVKRHMSDWSDQERLNVRSKAGYAVPFVDTRHVDDSENVLDWDGQSLGELEVRGPWVAGRYYNDDEQKDRFTPDGWFKTGDIASIDAEGYVQIADRSKDVIKSGGEWISSVELENALMAHPKILEAAVFAGVHPKWDERPIAAVVLKGDETVTKQELTAYLEPKFAKFWLPDEFLFLDELPKTSVGKFKKSALREKYGDILS